MKTLLKLTGLFLLFFVGCTSNQEIEELNAPALTKFQNQVAMQAQQPKTVTVPMKVDFYCTPDETLPYVECTPSEAGIFLKGGGVVNGNATHVGLVNSEKSPWLMTGCSFNPMSYQLTSYVAGKITAANGDYFFYTGQIVTQLPDYTFTGEIIMNDGTGKFKGVTGSVLIEGGVDMTTGVLSWSGEGTVTFVVRKE